MSAKTYFRSGEPSALNNNNVITGYEAMGTINNTEGLTSLMPQVSTWNLTNGCRSNPHAYTAFKGVSCLDSTQYSAAQTGFGNLRRNALYGPHYANSDMTLSKSLFKRESMNFSLGAQAYNIFNHANFANPGDDFNGDTSNRVGSSSFGVIGAVVAPPTSPYGSFQSAAVTQRVLVVTGKFTF